jgi:hypothetical protein
VYWEGWPVVGVDGDGRAVVGVDGGPVVGVDGGPVVGVDGGPVVGVDGGPVLGVGGGPVVGGPEKLRREGVDAPGERRLNLREVGVS